MSERRGRGEPQISFLVDGRRRRVSLSRVALVERGGRLVAPLLDLWVASALPGDLLDLQFEIVVELSHGRSATLPAIDGPGMTRAFVELSTGRLWWHGPRAGMPRGLMDGLVIRSIVVGPAAQDDSGPPHPLGGLQNDQVAVAPPSEGLTMRRAC